MKKIILLVLSLLLISCANQYTSNGESHYMRSHNGPTLNVPPPLTSANLSDFYDLPNQTQSAKVNIKPPK